MLHVSCFQIVISQFFMLIVKTVLLLGAFLLLTYCSLMYIIDYIHGTHYM
jgi:hypothetical protein